LVALKKVKSHQINIFQTLSSKHPGWGTLRSPLATEVANAEAGLFPPARRTFGGQLLCFHIHADCPGVVPNRARKSSWHESSFDEESRKKLCGTLRVGRTCPTKSKIPIVTNFASERANQQERTDNPFNHAPSPRPAHSIAAADWTVFIVSKLYKAHRTAFIRAG
jgi:hypothetical protein